MEVEYPNDVEVSDECKQLIRDMLCPLEDRITIDDIMQRPWFIRGDRFRRFNTVPPLLVQACSNHYRDL